MLDVILDSLFDSIKAFIVVFLVYVVLSFFEEKISSKLNKNNKLAPLYGAGVGLIPQCGISVIAADLYVKKYITMGTIIAIFLSCSDEAIPIILSSSKENALMVIPLIFSKFLIGFFSGFVIDLIASKYNYKKCDNSEVIDIDIGGINRCSCGCCIEEEPTKFDKHLWYPFVHSMKLLLYVLIINIVFGFITYFLGEENIISFLENSKYLSPIYACVVGLIPNCASSIILAELFINGGLSFGATLAGLCVNAGLGLVFIFKNKKNLKENIYVLITMLSISISVGYIICSLFGF